MQNLIWRTEELRAEMRNKCSFFFFVPDIKNPNLAFFSRSFPTSIFEKIRQPLDV